MFVICLHLVSADIRCLAPRRSEMCRRGSAYFQGASNSNSSSYLVHGLFHQKGNRCAVMSTVDYSCNIARKKNICAPAAWTERASEPASSPSCQTGSFQETDRGVSGVQFSTADRETIVHTHFWSTLLMPFSLQTQREVRRPRLIRFSAGWLALAREAFECLLDVIYRESRYKQQLSTGALFAEAQVQSCALLFPWELSVITWIMKRFPGLPSSLFLTVQAWRETPKAASENVLLTAALKGICGISCSWNWALSHTQLGVISLIKYLATSTIKQGILESKQSALSSDYCSPHVDEAHQQMSAITRSVGGFVALWTTACTILLRNQKTKPNIWLRVAEAALA